MTAVPGPSPARTLSARDRMVRSAMALICVQGVSGTGLREVVEHADAPRGSLRHYFPDGKEQLVGEALALAARAAARSTRVAGSTPGRPSDVLAAMVAAWRGWLTGSDFALGCPLVASMADVGSASAGVRAAAERTLTIWQEAVEGVLTETGVPASRVPALASVTISALEGAIVMARTRHSVQPLDDLLAELSPLLDAAAGRA